MLNNVGVGQKPCGKGHHKDKKKDIDCKHFDAEIIDDTVNIIIIFIACDQSHPWQTSSPFVYQVTVICALCCNQHYIMKVLLVYVWCLIGFKCEDVRNCCTKISLTVSILSEKAQKFSRLKCGHSSNSSETPIPSLHAGQWEISA